MRNASLKYRLRLPGFVLPEAVFVALQAYDEYSARLLENIADRVEGRMPQERSGSTDSSVLLEQIQESCRMDESRLLISGHGGVFVPLLRQIERLTSRLVDQLPMELDSVSAVSADRL